MNWIELTWLELNTIWIELPCIRLNRNGLNGLYWIGVVCVELNWIELYWTDVVFAWIALNWTWNTLYGTDLIWTELNPKLLELKWIGIGFDWLEETCLESTWIAKEWIELNWLEMNWIELNWNGTELAWMKFNCNWIKIEFNCTGSELDWIDPARNGIELNLLYLVQLEFNFIELNWQALTWLELI